MKPSKPPVTESSEITRLNQQFNILKQERDKSWLSRYRDIRRYISPDDGLFEGDIPDDVRKSDSKIINPFPRKALNTLRSGMLSGMTSPSSSWFKLTVPHETSGSSAVVRWLYDVQKAMEELMIKSNLYNILPMVYGSMAAYGTAVMTVMPDPKEIVRCTHMPVGSYMLNTNNNNVVDTMYREIPMTAKMMVNEFGIERVSQGIKIQYEMGALTWNKVYQAIEPNPDHDPNKLDTLSMPYRCTYWESGNQTNWLQRTGYRRFPAMCPRWDVNGNNVYGTGPGFVALGKCKELQVLEQDKLRLIRTGANPSMTAPVSLRGQRATTVPGEITWVPDNLVGVKYAPTYVPDRAWLQEVRLEIQQCEQDIGGAFFADLFLMISQLDSTMTAYEVSVRKEEKMLMLGPVLERSDDELLDPLIDSYFSIMLEQSLPIWQGLLPGIPLIPPPPEELAGMDLKVEYISILAQAQKMTGVSNIERAIGFTTALAQIQPDAVDMLNGDDATTQLYTALGVPPTMLRSMDEVAAMREAKAQQQAALQSAAAAQAGAETGKTLAETPMGGDTALSNMMGTQTSA